MRRTPALTALSLTLVPCLVLAAAHGVPAPRSDRFEALHGEAGQARVVAVLADATELAVAGFDLAQHGSQVRGEPVHVVAGPRDLERLAVMGLEVLELRGEDGLDLGVLDDDWNSLEDIQARVASLVADNSDILVSFSSGTSIEGRPITTVRVSSTPGVQDPARPKLSFNGNHHAREVMTVEASLDILTQIVGRYRAGDAEVVRWVEELEIYVTPVSNPDGYHHVVTQDTWWRKNRRDNAGGSKGVDLNRNYPYAWGANDSGSSGNPHSETYRGAGPASEPEAQALVALARRIKPLFNLSYHSYGEVLLYPYGYENAVNPVGDVMEVLAAELSSRMTKDTGSDHYAKRSRLYPVNGLDRDWYYHELGTYSFVPEISNSRRGFHPAYSWVQPTVTGLRGGWQYLCQRAVGESLRGVVVDGVTGAGLDAVVRVSQVQWKNGEIHRTDVDGGFSRLLDAGTYTLEVTADGYQPRSVPVVVPAGLRAWAKVALVALR